MSMSSFYHYKEIEDDEDKAVILAFKDAFGYLKAEPREYNDDYLSLMEQIRESRELSNVKAPKGLFDRKKVENSISYWNALNICLHDVAILSSDEAKVKRVHPSKIPIVYGKGQGAYLSIGIPLDDESEIKEPCIEKLFIAKEKTFLSVGSYNHELTHSQLISVKGICEDILNSEALPIFMEMIFSTFFDKSGKAFDILTRSRLMDVGERLNLIITEPVLSYEERVTSDYYIQSIIVSANLLNIYYGSSECVRREMLDDVNSVFSGRRTVEDMLKKYDSDIDSIPKDLKCLRKTFPKK